MFLFSHLMEIWYCVIWPICGLTNWLWRNQTWRKLVMAFFFTVIKTTSPKLRHTYFQAQVNSFYAPEMKSTDNQLRPCLKVWNRGQDKRRVKDILRNMLECKTFEKSNAYVVVKVTLPTIRFRCNVAEVKSGNRIVVVWSVGGCCKRMKRYCYFQI